MDSPYSLYIPRSSAVHRLHPLTKLALVGFCLVLGLLLPGVWMTYAVFILIILPLATLAHILPQFLSATIKAIAPLVISVFLVQGFFWPGGTPIFHLGPFSLKEEGVLFAARTVGRLLVILSSFLLLSFTARPDQLMVTLNHHGVPNSLSYIVLSTLQIVPQFRAKANAIVDAQRSRGLETEGNLIVRARTLGPLVLPLLLGSIVDIEERAIALEVRAFGRQGPKTSLLVLHDSGGQRVFRLLLLLAALGVIVWRLYVALAPRFLS